jgi:hypothetical protein
MLWSQTFQNLPTWNFTNSAASATECGDFVVMLFHWPRIWKSIYLSSDVRLSEMQD